MPMHCCAWTRRRCQTLQSSACALPRQRPRRWQPTRPWAALTLTRCAPTCTTASYVQAWKLRLPCRQRPQLPQPQAQTMSRTKNSSAKSAVRTFPTCTVPPATLASATSATSVVPTPSRATTPLSLTLTTRRTSSRPSRWKATRTTRTRRTATTVPTVTTVTPTVRMTMRTMNVLLRHSVPRGRLRLRLPLRLALARLPRRSGWTRGQPPPPPPPLPTFTSWACARACRTARFTSCGRFASSPAVPCRRPRTNVSRRPVGPTGSGKPPN
mmetsp:Transcript_3503/g.11444  ORF Transcript_3503/g.11444 Transcript_3503/m.11444 type:complete len:269 (-) Transcript_3503:563-1369(-)